METEVVARTAQDVKEVVVDTLEVRDRADRIAADTALIDALPELDSLAVVELVLALERRFGLTFEDDEVTAEVFATLATLTAFVDRKLG